MDATGGLSGTGRPTTSHPANRTNTSREREREREFEEDLTSARRAERRADRQESAARCRESRSTAGERLDPREPEPPVDEPSGLPAEEPSRPEAGTAAGIDAEPDDSLTAEGSAPSAARGETHADAPGKPTSEGAAADPQFPGVAVPRGSGAASEVRPNGPVQPFASPMVFASAAGADLAQTTEPLAAVPAPVGAAQPGPAAAESGAAGDGDLPRESQDAPASAEARAPATRSESPSALRPEAAATQAEARAERPATALQASTGGAQPGAAAPQAEVNEYAASILRQVRLRLSPQLRQASLQLEPARLGRLTIRLELRRGVTRAEVVAEQETTFAALEQHLPELRAALATAGFEGVEVDLRHAGDGSAPSPFAPRGAAGSARAPAPSESPVPQDLTRVLATRLTNSGGVDTYA